MGNHLSRLRVEEGIFLGYILQFPKLQVVCEVTERVQ